MPAHPNNNYASKYTDEEIKEIFEKVQKYAEEDKDCLCLEDAIFKAGIAYSTYFDRASKHEDLDHIKEDAKRAIKRRINKLAINADAPPAAAIWRMKQLGERDEKHMDHTSKGEAVNIPVISWVDNESD